MRGGRAARQSEASTDGRVAAAGGPAAHATRVRSRRALRRTSRPQKECWSRMGGRSRGARATLGGRAGRGGSGPVPLTCGLFCGLGCTATCFAAGCGPFAAGCGPFAADRAARCCPRPWRSRRRAREGAACPRRPAAGCSSWGGGCGQVLSTGVCGAQGRTPRTSGLLRGAAGRRCASALPPIPQLPQSSPPPSRVPCNAPSPWVATGSPLRSKSRLGQPVLVSHWAAQAHVWPPWAVFGSQTAATGQFTWQDSGVLRGF